MHFLFLERWFGKDWREVYLILHEDSTLMWYSERGDSSPEGGVFLKDCPEMIAAGQVSIFLKRSIFTTSKTDRQILCQKVRQRISVMKTYKLYVSREMAFYIIF